MRITNTPDIILKTAMTLFSQKGFNAVTTKDISQKAGVSEMTLFRHFRNKRTLFERAFEKYVFAPKFKDLFENNLAWDLEKDLLKVSFALQDTFSKNKKIILAHFKDDRVISGRDSPLFEFPHELKSLLVDYFSKMKKRKILKGNPKLIAISFLNTNVGIFMNFSLIKAFSADTDMKTCVKYYVRTLVSGIAT